MIMKTTFFLLMAISAVRGTPIDTIAIEHGTFGNSFYYKDASISSRSDIKYLLIWSSKAYREFKATRPLYLAKTTTLTVGASLIGFSIVQSLFSKSSFNWSIGLIGTGGVMLSIPLHFRYNRRISEAVNFYNNDMLTKVSSNGIGRP